MKLLPDALGNRKGTVPVKKPFVAIAKGSRLVTWCNME